MTTATSSYIDQGEFELIHQRVQLSVTPSDEKRCVKGVVEMTVIPLSEEAATLVVNCRQSTIDRVR
jgi:hypothetical protein